MSAKIKSIQQDFKKGKIYQVDQMENIPKEIYNDYFDQDFEITQGEESKFEWGASKCKKSFTLVIEILSK